MLYCQQCGARNSDDARFCNQCGGEVAQAGEPGGPLPTDGAAPTLHGHGNEAERQPSAPPPPSIPSGSIGGPPAHGFDVSTMSLSAIGVRSRGKAWGVILGFVAALVGIGAGGMWLAMHAGDGQPVAANESGQPDPDASGSTSEEVVVGDAIPEGAEVPDVDFVPGSPQPTKAASRARARRRSASRAGTSSTGTHSSSGSHASSSGGSGSTTSSNTTGSNSGGSGSGSSGSGSSGSGSSRASSGGSGSTTGSSGSSGSGSSGSGSSGSGSSGSGSGSGGATGGGSDTVPDTIPDTGGSGGSEPDWDALAAAQDNEMDLYASRVRQVVRSYYVPRAQSCFEHASRNEQSVRGTVVIGFDIQADGTIHNPEVARNTTGIDSLGRCLATQVGSWRLPRPPEAPLAMQMPFAR